MAIERIHPMIVHFPIALLITSVFLDFLMLATKRENFERSGFHLLILGVVGAATAITFGWLAEDAAASRPHIADTIETHETLALTTAGIFIALLVIRYLFMRKNNFEKIRIYYLIAAILGIGLLLSTAYYGGQLVYDYGAAVSSAILK
ncbi:MAG: DUF2231 domain-containing protein [Deltaproteobacteria bacterium]|nr:DUF2231 domain-containing protein [Deltaproteobacteria bacterium]